MDGSAAPSGPDLLLVGLDAGCQSVLDDQFAAGTAPTIERLCSSGTVGPLESQIPPWTASAWPSLYTGTNPGKHGVFDFLTFDGYDWDVVNATHVRSRPIWELLDEHGYSSVVVNVPVTHPARAFDGALVPGLTAPEDPACHPDGILSEIEDAIGPYRIYPQSWQNVDDQLDAYERTIRQRGRAFRYLLDRFEPEFAFVQFQLTDSVFHERPGDDEAVETVYAAVDRELERTLETVDPGAVMLVSDHGIGPVRDAEVRVNEVLSDHQLLERKQGGEGMPTWSRAFENDFVEGADASEHSPGALERAIELAAKVGITTQRVAGVLDQVGLAEPIGRHVPNDVIRAGSEQVDFPASAAYVRSKSELGVRLNVEGREPNGQVPAAEYERVRSRVVDLLADLETPQGEPVFDRVGPREAFFEGPHLANGPDIVTVPRDFDTALVARLAGDAFGEPIEPWNHKRTGVIAATGPTVADVPLTDAHLFDVAPTICAYFGVPIDETMDGRALPIVGSGEIDSYPAYDPGPTTATNDGTVEDRLSDLGYL
ncbi:type I phosphodiesterase/nucleotide pyrophosphatase [Halovivax asiaticus JCM 14624]|uniref:Type I phosphodiesterase/nucleotide pyrophosphatase n=1 Tax=Halovivax asiaticus JCM 14624 TaxID=1227490 RepID=M0BTP8_9EURY|nr:alkaline phosphatase family protein [Halovivax asiaticus]ELZ14340.1 type I phosphodiesterase/nucleotide pyrophosphatase [Halovivax asiaticus JCM 14624]